MARESIKIEPETVESYRIDQLEVELGKFKDQGKDLSFGQVKQMFAWIGLPVAIATSVFGLALWQTIERGTVTAAEARAEKKVEELTEEISRLEARATALSQGADEMFGDLREIKGRANEAATSIGIRANEARQQAIDAERELTNLKRLISSVPKIESLSSNIETIVTDVASKSDFQEAVADKALDGLSGLVAAFDRDDGCPTGWVPFEPANGRFILGVDGDKYRLPYEAGKPQYQLAGEESVTLKAEHMPKHGHGVSTGISGNSWYHDGFAGGASKEGIDTTFNNPDKKIKRYGGHGIFPDALEKVGGMPDGTTSPHKNMPPYVALYFCKRGSS